MKLLVVYSNHQTGNFNAELLERLKKKATQSGHELAVRDLYRINFDPVLRTSDFEMISKGNPPLDIAREQEFVRWADILIFIYPVWWGGMPAIVKGYIDRVFSWGFAYKSNGTGVFPLLNHKKAVIISTMGQSKEDYENGMLQAMTLVNQEGVFSFCGIEVASQLFFPSIHGVSEHVRESYFREAGEIIDKLPVPEMLN